jgi:hypothetical protein
MQELVVSPKNPVTTSGRAPVAHTLTVAELLLAFWRHAEQHYRHPDGTPTSEIDNFAQAIRITRELYGHTLVWQFGPLALRRSANDSSKMAV